MLVDEFFNMAVSSTDFLKYAQLQAVVENVIYYLLLYRVHTSVYYSRERPVRKVDSGRIHFEKEKNHHDTIESHVYSRDVVYDQEFSKSRDKGTEREQRKRDRDLRSESAREKRGGDRIDSLRNVDEKGYNVKDWVSCF